MTEPGDAPHEMTYAEEIDDARAERLLRTRGHGAHLQGDAAGLFVAAVADLGQVAPAPTGALAALLADGFVLGDTPAAAPAPGSPLRRQTDRRSRRPLLVRVLAGAAVIGFATAASAGVLPDTVQDKLGGLLEATTPFEFPSSGDPASVPAPGDLPTGKTAPTPTATPSNPPDSGPAAVAPVGPAAVEPVGPPPVAPPGFEPLPRQAQAPSTSDTPTPSAAPQPPAREAAPDEVPGPPVDPSRGETPGPTAAPTPAPAAERPASPGEPPAAGPPLVRR